MAVHPRAVLDTNVVLAAQGCPHPSSPGREIMERWKAGQLMLLYSTDTLVEYAEKLLARGLPESEVERFIRLFARHGEAVPIVFFHFRHYPVDSDDVMFLLCAMNGAASHLVSYDGHLLDLRSFYEGELTICQPLELLAVLRLAFPLPPVEKPPQKAAIEGGQATGSPAP